MLTRQPPRGRAVAPSGDIAQPVGSMTGNTKGPPPPRAGALRLAEAVIVVVAVFAADIALARIVDIALDAFHR